MNTLRQAVMSVCFTAIAVGIIEILLPKNSFKAPLRLMTGSVLLISMLVPFANGIDTDSGIDYKLYDYSVTDSMMESVAISVKESIAEIIERYGVTYSKIEIIMDKGEDNSIIISKAMLYFYREDMDKAEQIVADVRNRLEIDAFICEAVGTE